MELLRSTFVEDPVYVYVGLGMAMVVLGAISRRRRGPRWLAAALAMPVLAAGIFIVGRVVVTDRQVIDRQCQEIAQDLSAGKVDAAERYLDDDFGGFWATKSIAIEAGAAAIKQFDVGKVSLQGLQTKVDNKHAVTTVRTMISVRVVGGQWPMDWKLHWVKKSQGWRIVEAGYTQPQLGGQ